MITEIKLIPDIPNELKVAAKKGILIPFIGAGVSQLAGCPGWSGFADKCLEYHVSKERLNHAQLANIYARQLNPKVRIALALNLADKLENPLNFKEILHPNDRWESHQDGFRIYQALSNLSKNFVTTNYDLWLDSFIPTPLSNITEQEDSSTSARKSRISIYRPEEIAISLLDKDIETVIHLHGSAIDPENMLLTTRDYIERYSNRNASEVESPANKTQTFLYHLFHQKNILFIGYGLDELEILEYVIQKSELENMGRGVTKHFILQPFFSHELDLANDMSDYFKNQCNVTLIPYLRDNKNYAQLIEVIEDFARNISVSPILNIERQNILKRLLNG